MVLTVFWCRVELGWWCVSSAERCASVCCSNASLLYFQQYIAWSEHTRSSVLHSVCIPLVSSLTSSPLSEYSSFSLFLYHFTCFDMTNVILSCVNDFHVTISVDLFGFKVLTLTSCCAFTYGFIHYPQSRWTTCQRRH